MRSRNRSCRHGCTSPPSETRTDPSACDKARGDVHGHAFLFSGKAGLYAQGPANRWRLFIHDVNGTRFVAAILSYARTPKVDLATARNVIDSIDFDP